MSGDAVSGSPPAQRAIDMHVHPPTAEYLVGSSDGYLKNAFRVLEKQGESISEMVAEYRVAGVERDVLLAWDARTATKRAPTSNEYVRGLVNEYPDFFIGFGSVDPHLGADALAELRRFRDYEFRGLKLHPIAQAFYPSDRAHYPLWDAAQELGLVALFMSVTQASAPACPAAPA